MAKSRNDDHVSRLPGRKFPAVLPRAVRVPIGKVEWVLTFLEMTRPPVRPALHRSDNLMLLRAEHPTVSFYRYLYNTAGEQWLWHGRRRWSDEELSAVICNAQVEIHVLYVAGVPAGFAELDRRRRDEVELVHLGMIPEYAGVVWARTCSAGRWTRRGRSLSGACGCAPPTTTITWHSRPFRRSDSSLTTNRRP